MSDSRLLNLGRARPRRLRFSIDRTRSLIGLVETTLYIIVGVLLVAAGAMILWDTIAGFVAGMRESVAMSDLGLRFLDRVLLLLIVAELLYTLQLVIARGQIAAEPFLFIGIIAAVRRVVVITAEIEHLPQEGRALTNFLLELGLLALLVIAFGIAIYFIRRGAAAERAA
ncbi:MAG TPA: phosphate-starvation-inducible PsiE family protein [Solirubrobacteraceae bacterium]|nr:phosphate-starvation-inducible PsiE family protein [Solirubrobacteraceae bacterium]